MTSFDQPTDQPGPVPTMTSFSPREIVSELDRYIVGQHEAKREATRKANVISFHFCCVCHGG